ncbi:hypothetical protein BRD18_02290 [Halobacteriales archaeon SW_7_71_33]|nr:MAG: hypothetical protein BRD18_02290 [Halobacteriales archaeon SW_7_71_33]
MSPVLMAAIVLAAVNSVMLVALSGVWVRNYRTFGSNLTLGLLAFGLVLLAENLMAVVFFFGMGTLYGSNPLVGPAVLLLRALETVAVVFLTYVTMQ